MAVLLSSSNWPLEWPLVPILVAGVMFFLGGRASRSATTTTKRLRGASFYGGLAVLALAIDSPVDAYAGRLFWVHMVQHVLLMMVAPPLLLLGRPWPRLLRPLPLRARRPLARTILVGPVLGGARRLLVWVTAPLQAFALFNGVLLAWHLPVLYDLTLTDGPVHALEHALFFSTALAFWIHLVPGASSRPRLPDGARALYATGGIAVGWVLALVLGFAPDPIYRAYVLLEHRPGGLSALADQQLAAGVMWVPGSVPYTIALFVAAYRWLGPSGVVRRDDLRPRET